MMEDRAVHSLASKASVAEPSADRVAGADEGVERGRAVRCLYLVGSDPISPNFRGGGSAIYYEHLAALAQAGHEVHLWHYAYPEGRASFEQFVAGDGEVWAEVRGMCRSVRLATFSARQGLVDRIRNKVGSVVLGKNPVPRVAALRQLKELIGEIGPDVIWAQHLEPTLLAAAQAKVRVVYSHHDWLYRIKALRFERAENEQQRRLEEKLARDVAAVVSGSAVECEELRELGCRQVHYIPVCYDPVSWEAGEAGVRGSARLVHLGGMGTTASRVGLERFSEVVWPEFDEQRPELVVVGDISAASAKLGSWLGTVECLGYVRDLESVLRPYDLHIIPWEHQTGQRTRLPVAFNHGQVVVAVKESVACFPEAKDGKNCRLVGRLEEMAGVIKELLVDGRERERLGRAARATFESCFTREALLPRYEAVLSSVLAREQNP